MKGRTHQKSMAWTGSLDVIAFEPRFSFGSAQKFTSILAYKSPRWDVLSSKGAPALQSFS